MWRETQSKHSSYKRKNFEKEYHELNQKAKNQSKDHLTFLEKMSEIMSLPPEIFAGSPFVTLYGQNEVSIENHKKILYNSEERIVLQTSASNLVIEGKRLKITYYAKDEIHICGCITQISYQAKTK